MFDLLKSSWSLYSQSNICYDFQISAWVFQYDQWAQYIKRIKHLDCWRPDSRRFLCPDNGRQSEWGKCWSGSRWWRKTFQELARRGKMWSKSGLTFNSYFQSSCIRSDHLHLGFLGQNQCGHPYGSLLEGGSHDGSHGSCNIRGRIPQNLRFPNLVFYHSLLKVFPVTDELSMWYCDSDHIENDHDSFDDHDDHKPGKWRWTLGFVFPA